MTDITMNPRMEILAFLDVHAIPYELYEHEPAFTIEACMGLPFLSGDVTLCKNVFLCNRQQTDFYLMLLGPHTSFRTAVVSKALGVSRLSFAPEDALFRLLHLRPGSVSPLGLYFDKAHAVTLCYERAIRETARIAFHPGENNATVVFDQGVFWGRVLPLMGIGPVEVGLEVQAADS
ncbi:MAG: prolyl-tRNA synthetase associated domain-containing protein [Clostridiales bacterium]|nr:prolyl-tRNA synthetase associated domain-containing protein [Clostridiales bacterium]